MARRTRAVRVGVSWIASSAVEIANTRTLLHSLSPQNTLDELGFQRLFAGFADSLYPATTTIMTRARYFVFLPAIFRHIDDLGLAQGKDADRVSRDWQDKLRQVLVKNEPIRGAGVIGKGAGRNLSRTASIIYWSGLASLGIRAPGLSESGYLESLSQPSGTRRSIRDDDGSIHDIDTVYFWDPAFRTPRIITNGEVVQTLNFALTYQEAHALQARFALKEPDGHPTLLTHCINEWAQDASEVIDPQYPWSVSPLPNPLRQIVEHAAVLSLFGQGATLLYHAALLTMLRYSDEACKIAFKDWFGYARDALGQWDLDVFTRLRPVRRSGGVIDVPFLRELQNRVISARNADRAYADPTTRDLIAKRERQVRIAKARLRGGHYLRLWKPPAAYPKGDYYALTYRHAVGMRFARDIADGLKRSDA
jgi:hypothetical protein